MPVTALPLIGRDRNHASFAVDKKPHLWSLPFLTAVAFCTQGAVSEFRIPKNEDPFREEYQFAWRFGNGTFGLILLSGLVFTALLTRRARSWAFGTGRTKAYSRV